MTNTTTIGNAANDIQNSGLEILGNIVWCHVRNALVPRDKANDIADGCGLDTKWLPKAGSLLDVFRRAASESSGRKVGRFTYMVRKVSDKGGVVIRHIVCEERDEKGKRLGYETVCKVRYYGGNKIESDLCDGDDLIAKEMVSDIKQWFEQYRENITGEEIHRMMKKVLDSYSRVAVHPTGGVYFVPNFYSTELRLLQCFVKEIDKYSTGDGRADKNIFAIVPLPNVAEQRETVAGAFTESFKNEVESAISEMSEILKSKNGKPASNLVGARAAQLAAMQEKLADYKKLIGSELDMADFRMDLLVEQISDLAGLGGTKLADSEFGQAATNAVNGAVEFEDKSSYTVIKVDGRLVGRARYTRSGINMYTPINLYDANHELADRSEYKEAGKNGFAVSTKESDVFGLFVAGIAEVVAKTPQNKGSQARSGGGKFRKVVHINK